MAENMEPLRQQQAETSSGLEHLKTQESLFSLKQRIGVHLEQDDQSKGEKVDASSALRATDQLLGKYVVDQAGNPEQNAMAKKLRENPELQKQISSFLIGALTQTLPQSYAGQYDIEAIGAQDGEVGVDAFELQQLFQSLDTGIQNILKLKDFHHFEQVQQDIAQLEDPQTLSKQTITEKAFVKLADVTPEEQSQLLAKRPNDPEFLKGCMFAVAKEVGGGVEELFSLVKDLLAIIATNQVVPFRYAWYRYCQENAQTSSPEKQEYTMKIQAMSGAHPFIDLVHTLSTLDGWGAIKDGVFKLFDSDITAQDVGRTIGLLLALAGGVTALKKLLRKPGMFEKVRPGFAFGAAVSLGENTVDVINTSKNGG